jgi:hypothetical protein
MNVAIIGQMASGKTTCSKYLVENLGYTRISLAEPIYWVVGQMGIMGPEDLFRVYLEPYIEPPLSNNKIKKFIDGIKYVQNHIPNEIPKPRKRLQWLGTECGRNQIRKTIWIDILLKRIEQNPEHNYVVDDVRFENELKLLKKANFLTIKLKIDRNTQIKRLERLYGQFDQSILTHGSEIEIEGLRGDVDLDSTLELYEMLRSLKKIVKGAKN